MKKTQFAAFLLSGLLVLNTAIPAFAESMTQQRENAQTYAAPDTEAPEVTEVTVDKAEVTAPGKITVTVKAEDKIGVSSCFVKFVNRETGREIYKNNSGKNPLSIEFDISEYEAKGLFELDTITIEDKIGNERIYGGEAGEALPKPIPSFKVINSADKADSEAPKVTEVTVDKAEVTAPGKVTVTVKAEDKIGVSSCFVRFVNEKNGRKIYKSNSGENPLSIELDISEYEANGLFELDAIVIEDKIGNERIYGSKTGEALPKPIPSFKVINKDDELVPGESDDELVPGESDEELVPGQSENRPNKPERPSKPNNSGSSSGGIVNYDSEKPDPADKKATEMYNFWQNVKRKIKNTEEGKTLRVAVPAEYTYMPASVMETLRLNPEVSLKLSWGRDTVVIKAGTAQPKQKLKAYWTKSALLKLYPQK